VSFIEDTGALVILGDSPRQWWVLTHNDFFRLSELKVDLADFLLCEGAKVPRDHLQAWRSMWRPVVNDSQWMEPLERLKFEAEFNVMVEKANE
jgi:hypothetical protein